MPYVKNIQTITPLPAPVVNMSGVISRGIEHITKDSHCFNITQADIIQTPCRLTRERRFSDDHTFRFINAKFNPYSAGVPLMGRFKNQTQPNVIIDIYF